MNTNCPLYNLLEIAHGDAESVFQALVWLFERDSIPLSNIIGFATDTTNVMFGEHNSVASCLKKKSQTYFLRNVFVTVHTYVHHMPVKSFPIHLKNFFEIICTTTLATVPNIIRTIQSFAEVEPHKLLRPCQTRWLSMYTCVARVTEQWYVLIQYFQTVVDRDNLLVSQKILTHLQNP